MNLNDLFDSVLMWAAYSFIILAMVGTGVYLYAAMIYMLLNWEVAADVPHPPK